MPNVVQECGNARLEIDADLGARLTSLRIGDLEILRGAGPSVLEWGCYPMAPWTGRMRDSRFGFEGREYQMPKVWGDHTLHGTVYDRPWTVEDERTFSIKLTDPWPFRGFVRQFFTLYEDRLELRIEVHATERPMPASCGWHPWFRRVLDRGETARIEFQAGYMEKRDSHDISTDERVPVPPGPWDDAFGDVRWPVRVTWPGALALEVDSPCPFLVVYDERDEGLCVEPTTAPPDAFNRGLARIVEPGRPLVADCTWRWRSV